MCGIFGVILKPGAAFGRGETTALLERLFRLSESRGKESAGIHARAGCANLAWTLKGDVSGSSLLKSEQYRRLIRDSLDSVYGEAVAAPRRMFSALCHSRLVTNGQADRIENNQPVRYDGVTVVHNGIIVNVDALWRQHPELVRNSEVDTEVAAALLASSLAKGEDPVGATRRLYAAIEGAASIAWHHENLGECVLATNTGDLYFFVDDDRGLFVFASERYILEQALLPLLSDDVLASHPARLLAAGSLCRVVAESLTVSTVTLDESGMEAGAPVQKCPGDVDQVELSINSGAAPMIVVPDADESLLRYGEENVRALRRCSRCILPETFPYIEFDEQGECNYCKGYRPKYRGLDEEQVKREFIDSLQRYRSADASPDVLVPFSGGRDSCYGLHLIKKEFRLNPITFTYDWGMVTDLARRNIARLCGTLGVPNILVSADIKKKRENIRKNVSAWLRKPDLGMVPLFMAGDKHFFSVVNELKKQNGIRLDLWSANPLENTDFKSGFCGIRPDFEKSRIDYLSLSRKARLAAYYLSRFLSNPGYINSSLVDSATAFVSYYFAPRTDFYFIFHKLVWREETVNGILLSEYDFETSPDSPSTWRIGDGTAPFYNYIYMTARGFTEFDTFRSNQIREGHITREQALESVIRENRPRAESLRWYLSVIGLDFNTVVRTINRLDTLELHR